MNLDGFTDLEVRMYMLIKAQLASMYELKNIYTLDEALTLYALYKMETDIEYCRNKDTEEKMKRDSKR